MSNKTILSVAVAAICASSVIYIIGTAENTTTDLSNQKTSVITENINKVSSINKRSLTILPPDISLIPTMKPLKFQKSSLFSVEKSHSFYKQKRLHKNGELFFIEGEKHNDVIISDVNDAKKLILQGGQSHFKFNETDNLNYITSSYDAKGNVYYKFQQTYENLKVEGQDVVVQTNIDDEAVMLSGSFESSINLNTTPTLQGKQAIIAGLSQQIGDASENAIIHVEPELQVFIFEGKPTLSYRSIVEYSRHNEGKQLDELFVDANEGVILAKRTQIHTSLERKIYDMQGNCMKTGRELPGIYKLTEGGSSSDNHVQSAFENTGHSYWFYYHFLNRDSYDSQGGVLKSSVHTTFQLQQGQECSGDNAMFLAEPYWQMAYGEGGDLLKNPAGALDITAHELTHAVTATESKLKYENESGAINEALSDIFGSGAEAWMQSGGTASGNPSDGIKTKDNNWTTGEVSAQSDSMKRVMYDPTQDGQSKDNYNDRGVCSSSYNCPDHGYVHTNSGIMNLAFYLLSEGGKHPQQKSTNEVPGIGIEKALKIYYHASTNTFTSSTNFTNARKLLANSAKTLHGECSAEWIAVHESYDAVLVPGEWAKCSANDNTDNTDNTNNETNNDETENNANLALGSQVQASSTYSSGYAPSYSVDGNIGTSWVSSTIQNTYKQQWLMLDLGQSKTVQEVTLNWFGNNHAGQMAVWSWNGSQWLLLSQKTKGQGQDVLSFNAVNTQHLMVTFSYGSYGRWYIVTELEVK